MELPDSSTDCSQETGSEFCAGMDLGEFDYQTVDRTK